MNLSELYIIVDNHQKEIRGVFQKQPENWKNICTFPGLSDEEKSDLSWAGHDGVGFIRGESLKDYSCSDNHLGEVKLNIKRMSSEITKDLRAEGVVFEGYRFAIDLESIVFANFQNNRCVNIIKSQNDYHKFSRDQMFTLVERMNRRFDELLEQEIEFFRQIDECSSVYELSQLSYGI